MAIDTGAISTGTKSSKSGTTMTYRSSSPSSSYISLDESSSRGRKPLLQQYNPPPLSASAGYVAEPEDVLSSTENGRAGGVSASPGVGTYAYSTTLRRQPSLTLDGHGPYGLPGHTSHRASSPSPRGRRGSFGQDGGGVFGRILDMGKRLTGREYERVGEEDEEERRRSIERRARETPSAIYAHKSIDVSHQSLVTADLARSYSRTRYVISLRTQRPVSHLRPCRICCLGTGRTNSSCRQLSRCGSNSPKEYTKTR